MISRRNFIILSLTTAAGVASEQLTSLMKSNNINWDISQISTFTKDANKQIDEDQDTNSSTSDEYARYLFGINNASTSRASTIVAVLESGRILWWGKPLQYTIPEIPEGYSLLELINDWGIGITNTGNVVSFSHLSLNHQPLANYLNTFNCINIGIIHVNHTSGHYHLISVLTDTYEGFVIDEYVDRDVVESIFPELNILTDTINEILVFFKYNILNFRIDINSVDSIHLYILTLKNELIVIKLQKQEESNTLEDDAFDYGEDDDTDDTSIPEDEVFDYDESDVKVDNGIHYEHIYDVAYNKNSSYVNLKLGTPIYKLSIHTFENVYELYKPGTWTDTISVEMQGIKYFSPDSNELLQVPNISPRDTDPFINYYQQQYHTIVLPDYHNRYSFIVDSSAYKNIAISYIRKLTVLNYSVAKTAFMLELEKVKDATKLAVLPQKFLIPDELTTEDSTPIPTKEIAPLQIIYLNKNGNLKILGYWEYATEIPTDMHFIDICAGINHILLLSADGVIHAFGDNTFGQCDIPEMIGTVSSIAAGDNYSMAIDNNGNIHMWGANTSGTKKVKPPILRSKVVHINSNNNSQLVICEDGSIYTATNDFSYNHRGYINLSSIKIQSSHLSEEQFILLLDDGSITISDSTLRTNFSDTKIKKTYITRDCVIAVTVDQRIQINGTYCPSVLKNLDDVSDIFIWQDIIFAIRANGKIVAGIINNPYDIPLELLS